MSLPVLCQILGFLCCSPACSLSQDMKGKLTHVHTAFGIAQIIIGVINILVGILFVSLGFHLDVMMFQEPFWLGGEFLVVGIVCILEVKFYSPCLLIVTMILNLLTAALAITAVVLHSMDLLTANGLHCYNYDSLFDYSNTEKQMTEICVNYIFFRGLYIIMIVLSVLQFCVTISFCVLTGKALLKKDEDAKSVEDPELTKPLMEDDTAGAA